MILNTEKLYHTRDGRSVRIIATDFKNAMKDYPVVAFVTTEDGQHEIICKYNVLGKLYWNNDTDWDLLESTEWDDFTLDEPVLVRNGNMEEWKHRHFAGVLDGKPSTWAHGATSWTSKQYTPTKWVQCKRPDKKDENI
jgi:hypothetical protein